MAIGITLTSHENTCYITGPLWRIFTSLQWRHMNVMVFQITIKLTVCSTAVLGQPPRHPQSSALLDFCKRNPPVYCGFLSQRVSIVESLSMSGHQHVSCSVGLPCQWMLQYGSLASSQLLVLGMVHTWYAAYTGQKCITNILFWALEFWIKTNVK